VLSPVAAGLVAVAFAMVLGNLAAATQLAGDPRPLLEFDWWSPSRVIAGTANEFPSFSFVLGDLHAHVMATPFALLAAAYALQLALTGLPREGGRRRAAAELLLAALVLGSLYAVNTLDYPTALVLVAGGLLLAVTRATAPLRLRRAAAWGLALAAGSAVLVAPFVAGFTPETKGLALVGEHDPFTRFAADVVLLYALPLWILAAALAHRLRVPGRYLAWSAVALLVTLVLLAPSRLAGLFLVLTLGAVALHAALDARVDTPERFFWLLWAVGLGLVAVGDFAYIRDVFDDTPSYRFNTVFKAGYQAWFLLAVVAAVGLAWSGAWLRRAARRGWLAGLAVLLCLLAVYPVAGTYARTSGFSAAPTLDGERWLARDAPDDDAAVRWLRDNVHGTPTIVEALGADFSPRGHGRVSTFTGLPAVLGWAGHELQWGRDTKRRADDVTALYRTADRRLARRLLDRYGVRYVMVGSLERDQYPARGLAKFDELGRPVFRSGRTVIYAVGA
jgi:YYY domain-containing protein